MSHISQNGRQRFRRGITAPGLVAANGGELLFRLPRPPGVDRYFMRGDDGSVVVGFAGVPGALAEGHVGLLMESPRCTPRGDPTLAPSLPRQHAIQRLFYMVKGRDRRDSTTKFMTVALRFRDHRFILVCQFRRGEWFHEPSGGKP